MLDKLDSALVMAETKFRWSDSVRSRQLRTPSVQNTDASGNRTEGRAQMSFLEVNELRESGNSEIFQHSVYEGKRARIKR